MKKVPETGDRVTIRQTKIHDRSYQCDVWEVLAVNETHAQLRAVKDRGCLSNTIVVLLEEYEFSDALNFYVDITS